MTDNTEHIADLNNQLVAAEGRVAEAQAEVDRINSNAKPTEKPGLFEVGSDDKLSKELGAIFDKDQAKADRQPVFPERDGETLDARIERSYEWSEMSHRAKKFESDAAADAKDLKAVADKYGVDMQTAELIKQNHLIAQGQQQASEYEPVRQHLQSVFKDSTPAESAKFFAETTQAFRADPIGTLEWMAAQAGLSPMHVAQQLAQRHQFRQQRQPSQAEYQALESQLDRVAAELGDAANYEQDMVDIIGKNQIKRTGNYVEDYKAAYREAKRREKKLSTDERMQKEMSRSYDRSLARGR